MLSYQHAYHAGNHADVLKHIILGDVLDGLHRKDKPLLMLDAFASRGVYALDGEQARKNCEFDTGIGQLWLLKHEPCPLGIRRWFSLIEQYNPNGGFARFPGSTALLHSMQRAQDRLIACDLHPQEFDALRASFRNHRGFNLQKTDAFEAIKASLPPKEKRGLIFLDPSYEVKEEYENIAKAVMAAHKKFASGVYVIWYPVLPAGRHMHLFKALQHSGIRCIKRLELNCPDKFSDMQMTGSGLLIINPPFHAQTSITSSLQWLQNKLCHGQATIENHWLVPE